MLNIGLIFSTAQILQFALVLLTPILFRKLGLINGIAATQVLTAVALGCLAATQNASLAMAMYLGFSAMQWMSSPGLYNLLMSSVPDEERSAASSMTLFCNAVLAAAATAGAGILFTRFGYPLVLAGIAALAVVAAMLFRMVVGSSSRMGAVNSFQALQE
jgi:predicted MFS family arabinose efflux permease